MRILSGWTAAIVALLCAAPALADRAATEREAAAIERAALRSCERFGQECRFVKARVSTANARFAWAIVGGEGYSGALLKRADASSRRFRIVGTQGGGIGECRYWRKRAPRAVLRDLRIVGLVGSGAVRNCGKR